MQLKAIIAYRCIGPEQLEGVSPSYNMSTATYHIWHSIMVLMMVLCAAAGAFREHTP